MAQTSRSRWALPLLVVLAFVATGISLMLTSYHLTEGKEPWALFRMACGAEKGGCADVLASPWAVGPAGIPTAIPPEACCLGWQESLTLLAQLVEAEIPD